MPCGKNLNACSVWTVVRLHSSVRSSMHLLHCIIPCCGWKTKLGNTGSKFRLLKNKYPQCADQQTSENIAIEGNSHQPLQRLCWKSYGCSWKAIEWLSQWCRQMCSVISTRLWIGWKEAKYRKNILLLKNKKKIPSVTEHICFTLSVSNLSNNALFWFPILQC